MVLFRKETYSYALASPGRVSLLPLSLKHSVFGVDINTFVLTATALLCPTSNYFYTVKNRSELCVLNYCWKHSLFRVNKCYTKTS